MRKKPVAPIPACGPRRSLPRRRVLSDPARAGARAQVTPSLQIPGGTGQPGPVRTAGASAMPISSGAAGDGAIPEPDEPRILPAHDPPPGRAGDPAEVTLRLAQDRDRIAGALNDVVISRIFSAGLTLETALGLLDGHNAAAGKVRDALGELELAIRDVRNAVFDHRQPDGPSAGAPGLSGRCWRGPEGRGPLRAERSPAGSARYRHPGQDTQACVDIGMAAPGRSRCPGRRR
jgi:Histidine kinase